MIDSCNFLGVSHKIKRDPLVSSRAFGYCKKESALFSLPVDDENCVRNSYSAKVHKIQRRCRFLILELLLCQDIKTSHFKGGRITGERRNLRWHFKHLSASAIASPALYPSRGTAKDPARSSTGSSAISARFRA